MNDGGLLLSEENNIKEVREWIQMEHNASNHFIISTNEGIYKGIISTSTLSSDYNNVYEPVGTLVKHKDIYIAMGNSLRTAVEMMARENIDVLPVVSKDNTNIVGILSYHEIISAYKSDMDEHKKKQPHISIRRQSLKILLRGQKLFASKMK